jgi:hypothetical protein
MRLCDVTDRNTRNPTDNRDAFMWERVSQAEGSQELFCSRTANEQEFERQALKVLREQNWIAKITRLARMFTRIMSRT